MRTNVAQIFRLAAEFQVGRARLRAIGGNRHGGQIVFPIRQREAVAKRTIGAQFNLVPAKGDPGGRLGRAINDQLRVDVEPKTLGLFEAAKRTGKT